MSEDARRHAPAAERNKDFILPVLRDVLPDAGLVLEVASGTGQHVAWFASALPALKWQPSEPDVDQHASIVAWTSHAGVENVLPPVALDTRREPWPVETADAVCCINLMHVAPWESCVGLMRGSARLLPPGGVLFAYGPFRVDGAHVGEANACFDADLRARDPEWGIRDVAEVEAVGSEHGLSLERRVPTPRNNQSLVFRRA